jgi:hypothetical protein
MGLTGFTSCTRPTMAPTRRMNPIVSTADRTFRQLPEVPPGDIAPPPLGVLRPRGERALVSARDCGLSGGAGCSASGGGVACMGPSCASSPYPPTGAGAAAPNSLSNPKPPPPTRRVVTPGGCQIAYVDHTGCRQSIDSCFDHTPC